MESVITRQSTVREKHDLVNSTVVSGASATELSGKGLEILCSKHRKLRIASFRKHAAILILLALAIGWAAHGTRFRLRTLVTGFANSVRFITQDMLPPDLRAVSAALPGLIDTLHMSIIGCVLAVMLSLVLGVLGARNVTPHPAVGHVSRLLTAFIRAVPDIVFAIILVSAFGIGPVPGALALGIGGVGILAKAYAESIEEIDMSQIEALRASGATWLQVVGQGVWPQFKTAFVAWSLFRLDLNIRSAAVVGLVGAGGIGHYLNMNLGLFRYRIGTTVLLMVFVLIIMVEFVTARLRERLL